MHLFGLLGTLMFMIGFVVAAWLGTQKLYIEFHHQRAPLVTSNPWFFIALTTMILGTVLFMAGFIGELILRNSTVRNHYLLDKKINID